MSNYDYPELKTFLDDLAGDGAVPAGGAAAAVTGAMGAALVAKITTLASRHDDAGPNSARLEEIAARAAELSNGLHAQAGADATAYEAFMDELDPMQKPERLMDACEPPRRIAQDCAEAAELAVEALAHCPGHLVSDLGGGALLAGSACAMAGDAVGANIKELPDAPAVQKLTQEMQSYLQRAIQCAAEAKQQMAQ
ncbi:MAG: cyclodeaminase/cyclohydrolase family protein [Planctomycetota bacterium]